MVVGNTTNTKRGENTMKNAENIQSTDSQYHIDQTNKARELGFPYFQIVCDICGHVDTSMCWGGSAFDCCDGNSGNFMTVEEDGEKYTFETNCRTYIENKNGQKVGNYMIRELTGQEPTLTDWVRLISA